MAEALVLSPVLFRLLVFMFKRQLFIAVVTTHHLVVMPVLIVRILVLDHGGLVASSVLSALVDHFLQVYVAARVSDSHGVLVHAAALRGLRCSLVLLNFLHKRIMEFFLALLEVQVEVVSELS